MTTAVLPADHWVSRGLQVNFADGNKRVALIDARAGRLIDGQRPVKSNFREHGFTTFLDEAGELNDVLERAFASIERSVLNDVRRISCSNDGAELKAAVANLFAIHLVRNPSFKDFHEDVLSGFAVAGVADLVDDERLLEKFQQQFGRPPRPGELSRLVHQQYDAFASDPRTIVSSMIRQHDLMAEKLNRFHMQVIEVAEGLPGLALGDVPAVHGKPSSGLFGFRDRLALLDADVIVGPLTRRTAACFAVRRLPPVTVRTRRLLDQINATTLRAARSEVICHPDDELALRQLHRRLDRTRSPFG